MSLDVGFEVPKPHIRLSVTLWDTKGSIMLLMDEDRALS